MAQSGVIADDLDTISGAPTIFCGPLCLQNTCVPTNHFPELRRCLQDRDGRGRGVRAVDICGGVAGSEPPAGGPATLPARAELCALRLSRQLGASADNY